MQCLIIFEKAQGVWEPLSKSKVIWNKGYSKLIIQTLKHHTPLSPPLPHNYKLGPSSANQVTDNMQGGGDLQALVLRALFFLFIYFFFMQDVCLERSGFF